MIKVTSLNLLGEDDRGCNYEWFTDRSGGFMFCTRKAGSSSGQHYHEGRSNYKDPEILYLFTGDVQIDWCPLDGKKIETTLVKAPARIEVPVNVWHQVIATTDCCFIELNSIQDVQVDSIRIWRDEFEKMINK